MKTWILMALLLVGGAHAQTAKVIDLSPEDAKTAKALYEQREEIDKKIDSLREHVQMKYLSLSGKPFLGEYKAGWPAGLFTYSDDFRFIVPGNRQSGITLYNYTPCFASPAATLARNYEGN